MFFHRIQECGTERIAEQGIVKMIDGTPNGMIAGAAFGEEYMDMRVPF